MLSLEFNSAKHLTQCLGRVNIFYEGGKLLGDLAGVNMPVVVYNKWVSQTILTREEQFVLERIRNKNPVYIIGYVKGDKKTLEHECAHYKFYVDEKYRNKVNKLWQGLDSKSRYIVEKELKKRGYKEHNFMDEFQAYLIENPYYFGKGFENVYSKLK
jgi:hypothetical protein